LIPLPIDEALPALLEALRRRTSVVLQAPPGAGKTTRVPLALLDEPWLAGARIVMLEPRRLAARAAARRMASTLGERVGATVGFRVRMESVVGPSTRIEVVTEGVLARMIQSDPALEGIGIVIFDEFHERSLQADLGLALALQTQSVLRDDLRLLVMSATLDGEAVARMLDDAPIVSSEGRSYPVDVRHLGRRIDERIETAVTAAIRRSLAEEEGDVLVFLPGAGEIRRVASLLAASALPSTVDIVALHGNLPQEEQDRAIAPSIAGRRKVVLATSIAETSLTIEGIRVVIDSGLMRVPRFSPRSGMTRLDTVRVTRSSSEQRRGRAGRLGPGICYRLWNELEQAHLLPHGQPEILEADLAPVALELAVWGVVDPLELRWLDPPPPASFAHARELLGELGALDANGTVTPHGRRMAELPLHPRLAHMVLHGAELGASSIACDLAALLSERDIVRSGGVNPGVDVRLRIEALAGRSPADVAASIDRAALERVGAAARQIRARLGIGAGRENVEAAGLLLAFAYPDRIGALRDGQRGRFLLRNGRSAAIAESDPLAASEFVVAADLDGAQRESRVYLAAPISREEIERHFDEQLEEETTVEWDESGLRARRTTRLGAIVLRDVPIARPDDATVARALLERIRAEGLAMLPWTKGARALQERMIFARHHDATWPDVCDDALHATMEGWLLPHLHGMRRKSDLDRLDLHALLMGMLDWRQRRDLDEWAPTHLEVPSGSRIPIDYATPDSPVLAVRLQEMFGAVDTPRIMRGRVPLTVHLLSPAGRPVQVTRDLASFWRTGYFDVKKDLKGRYPKHYWPDDPLQAEPTRRVRPR
jgi:ATP-dependent helicase HrpB